MDSIRSPEIELVIKHCERCGLDHPTKAVLTYPEIASFTRFAVASLYSYHSRGGSMPRPYGRKNGNPKWSSCSIAKWIAGRLTPEEVEPARETPRPSTRRVTAKVGALLFALTFAATAVAASPDAFPSLTVKTAHALVEQNLAIEVTQLHAVVNATWGGELFPVVAIVFTGDGPEPRSGILYVYDPGPERFVAYAAMRGYTVERRYDVPYSKVIEEATRHLHPAGLRDVRVPLLDDFFAFVTRLCAAAGLGESGSLVITGVLLVGVPLVVLLGGDVVVRLFSVLSRVLAKLFAIWAVTRDMRRAARRGGYE